MTLRLSMAHDSRAIEVEYFNHKVAITIEDSSVAQTIALCCLLTPDEAVKVAAEIMRQTAHAKERIRALR